MTKFRFRPAHLYIVLTGDARVSSGNRCSSLGLAFSTSPSLWTAIRLLGAFTPLFTYWKFSLSFLAKPPPPSCLKLFQWNNGLMAAGSMKTHLSSDMNCLVLKMKETQSHCWQSFAEIPAISNLKIGISIIDLRRYNAMPRHENVMHHDVNNNWEFFSVSSKPPWSS